MDAKIDAIFSLARPIAEDGFEPHKHCVKSHLRRVCSPDPLNIVRHLERVDATMADNTVLP